MSNALSLTSLAASTGSVVCDWIAVINCLSFFSGEVVEVEKNWAATLPRPGLNSIELILDPCPSC